jgi:hypothetical protein
MPGCALSPGVVRLNPTEGMTGRLLGVDVSMPDNGAAGVEAIARAAAHRDARARPIGTGPGCRRAARVADRARPCVAGEQRGPESVEAVA